jgi:hypothetical protein
MCCRHGHKTRVGLFADQRVKAGKVDVVVQQHQITGLDVLAQRPGSIRRYPRLGPSAFGIVKAGRIAAELPFS